MIRIKIGLVISVVCVFACSSGVTKETNTDPTVETVNYHVAAVFDKFDAVTGKMSIHHEPIEGYMPEMDMTASIIDPKLADGLKQYDVVDLEILRKGAELTITSLKPGNNDLLKGGRQIYYANCAVCHAVDGKGVEKKGIPLISGHALDHTNEENIKRVTNGKGDEMPAFRDKLSAEQIKTVVDWVRETLQKAPPRTDTKKKDHHH